MSQDTNYGIPPGLGIEEQDLHGTISGAKPGRSHGALRRALAARWPMLAWRVTAPADEFTTDGGIVDQDMARVADRADTWLRQRIDEADGDHLAVWRRYKGDTALLRTAFTGNTLWACVAIGPNVADYLQLQIDQIQEFTVGPLVDGADWRRPHDADDLCAEPGTPTGDRRPIGTPHYRLRHAVHPARFLAELAAIEQQRRTAFIVGNVMHQQLHDGGHHTGTIAVTTTHRVPRGTPVPPGYREIEITDALPAYLTQEASLERFYADWAASSAGRLANHLFDHWAVRFSDEDNGGEQGRQLHGVPVWLTTRSLPKIETTSNQTAFALMDRLQRFDEKVGCAFAWYFFMLHGNRISPSVGEMIAQAVEDGIITLPRWDRDVLKNWQAAPYSF